MRDEGEMNARRESSHRLGTLADVEVIRCLLAEPEGVVLLLDHVEAERRERGGVQRATRVQLETTIST
jgi:hypothetical protein